MTATQNDNLVGRRVRLTGRLVNADSKWMPVEKDMPVGLTGTVVHVNFNGPREFHQISVRWDNGSGLGLFPDDPFVVLNEDV